MNRLILAIVSITVTSLFMVECAHGDPSCPYQGWSGDGCATENGSFLVAPHFGVASFFAAAAQSGESWASGNHPWNWNSPGIDYGVGPAAGTQMADPATARLPTGCVYQPTGSLRQGPQVYCDLGAVNPTFNSYDFGLHGCVVLMATHRVLGTLTISNSNFHNGPN